MSTFVYLVSAGPHHKVGITRDIDRRIKQIQTGNSDRVLYVSSFLSDDPLRDEKEIHLTLQRYRIRGEWFDLPTEQLLKMSEWFRPADPQPEPIKKPANDDFSWLIESLPY